MLPFTLHWRFGSAVPVIMSVPVVVEAVVLVSVFVVVVFVPVVVETIVLVSVPVVVEAVVPVSGVGGVHVGGVVIDAANVALVCGVTVVVVAF